MCGGEWSGCVTVVLGGVDDSEIVLDGCLAVWSSERNGVRWAVV